MKILVACEYSGIVREAFRALGHDAISCDLMPTEIPGPHIQGDVTDILEFHGSQRHRWDMIIAFPPCTHLAVSGAAHFKAKKADGRQQQGIDFFMLFTELSAPLVAIENPVGIMSTHYRKPDQIINPFQFGDPVSKKTCLWLKNLPKLAPTEIVEGSLYKMAEQWSHPHLTEPFTNGQTRKVQPDSLQGTESLPVRQEP